MLLFLYNLLLPPALIVTFPSYLRRMLKRGGYAHNFCQRFGIFSPQLRAQLLRGGWTWIRAVSVGEIMMALRLAEELKSQSPGFKAVISTTTSTGYALAISRQNEFINIIYSPIDWYPIVSFVWSLIRPSEVILIDSDLWPSFLAVASKKHCPVFLANARLSPRSERRFKLLRKLARPLVWNRITKVFSQDSEDRVRWINIGVTPERISVPGSMKYDLDPVETDRSHPVFDYMKQAGLLGRRPVLLGGSLHSGEEELLLNACTELRSEFPGLLLILVPRHSERAPDIVRLLEQQNFTYALRSNPRINNQPSVLIVNTTGELRYWYHFADIVVVGKSFYGIGGQNPVEALMACKPVITGPHMENFASLMRELLAVGGIVQLLDPAELTGAIEQLLHDQRRASNLVSRSEDVLRKHQGAIRTTAAEIIRLRCAERGKSG
ncbi:MAG: hypothetical protein JO076_17785 [Verrucomicrobia bacterium]|nr:hypothetical protein [Verrucomicrobiota bacterium]